MIKKLCLLLFVVILTSCKMPANTTPISPDMGAVLTEAVQTIYANLTLQAGTPAPGEAQAASQTPQTGGIPLASETLAVQPVETSTPQALVPTETATPETTATLTPEPSATATQAPPSPTPTTSGVDVRANLGDPTWKDSFSTGDNWGFGTDDHSKMEVKDGKAVLTAFNADGYYSWSLAWPKIEDFYLEIEVTTGECAGKDQYGVLFRSPDPSQGYVLVFSCDGWYTLRYYDGKKEHDLLDWSKSSSIQAGANQINRLGVKAVNDKISIYANGILIAEIQDDRQDKGFFGLVVGAAETENFTVQVEKVEYWELKP